MSISLKLWRVFVAVEGEESEFVRKALVDADPCEVITQEERRPKEEQYSIGETDRETHPALARRS